MQEVVVTFETAFNCEVGADVIIATSLGYAAATILSIEGLDYTLQYSETPTGLIKINACDVLGVKCGKLIEGCHCVSDFTTFEGLVEDYVYTGTCDAIVAISATDGNFLVWPDGSTLELSDDLGNHTATEDLAMAGFDITGVGLVDGRDVSADGTTQDSHIADLANPHAVTATQVGLGNVDNTADADKPVSTATQTALDTKEPTQTPASQVEAEAGTEAALRSFSPLRVKQAIDALGGGGGDNLGDHTATENLAMAGFDITGVGLVDGADVAATSVAAFFGAAHAGIIPGNPHGTSASDLGLGNVDNTADADKPISTATQAALDAKEPPQPQSTGVLTGGVLSTGGGATEFSISDGTGVIIDEAGTVTDVSWSGKTNITPTNLASDLLTWVGISSAGAVIEQVTPFTQSQRRSLIYLGVVVHVNLTTVDAVNNQQVIAFNAHSSVYDLADALGFINKSGNVFSANGANLTLDKSVGELFATGSNYDSATDNPHTKTLPALTALTFQYRYSDGSNGVTGTAITPDVLDDGAGGTTAVSNNQWSVQRIYSFISNNVKIQLGVADYSSKADAISGIASELYITEPSIAANGLLRGWLVVKKGATDLSDIAEAQFVSAGKLGEASAGGGGGGGGGGGSTVNKVPFTGRDLMWGISNATGQIGFHQKQLTLFNVTGEGLLSAAGSEVTGELDLPIAGPEGTALDVTNALNIGFFATSTTASQCKLTISMFAFDEDWAEENSGAAVFTDTIYSAANVNTPETIRIGTGHANFADTTLYANYVVRIKFHSHSNFACYILSGFVKGA